MHEDARLTRRTLLGAAGVTAAGLLVPRGAAAAAWRIDGVRVGPIAHSFASRPDLQPPTVEVSTSRDGTAAGRILVTPFTLPSETAPPEVAGALMLDGRGQPLWFRPAPGKRTAMDLHVQRMGGRDVLTWYEGTVLGAYGGSWLVADESYRIVKRVAAGNGYHGDLHDLVLTSRGTAVITIYNEVRADLTAVGGASDARVVEGVIQELVLATGKVVFEWHSLDHVTPDESTELGPTADGNVDYFHLNSVGLDADGHLLVSARHTSAVYKVHRRTGQVLWRLGGKRSDFALGQGAAFAYQHDARRHEDGTLTIFDNVASRPTDTGKIASRPIRLRLDEAAMTAALVRDYPSPDVRTAWAMGNAQQLPTGGLFVGWGMAPSFSELSRSGSVRFDARFVGRSVSYRARRQEWVGRPRTPPDLVVRPGAGGRPVAYMSWNGATEVARWRVLAGSSRSDLRVARIVARQGFETRAALGGSPSYVAAAALDATGAVLGTSATVAT